MAAQKKDKDDKHSSPENQSKDLKVNYNENEALISDLVASMKKKLPDLNNETLSADVAAPAQKWLDDNSETVPSVESNKAVLGVMTERVQAITSLSLGVIVPENVINKIKQNKVRSGSKFDTKQIIRLEDGPKVLTAALHVDLGFTPDKLRTIAEKLDPRIVIVVEDNVFIDKKLLAESFEAYLQTQQEKNLIEMSRSSRAGIRRNIILREIIFCLERVLQNDDALKEQMTKQINKSLSTLYKPLKGDDVLAFVESYRINEEKRRLRAQEAEFELLALEQLEQLESKNQL